MNICLPVPSKRARFGWRSLLLALPLLCTVASLCPAQVEDSSKAQEDSIVDLFNGLSLDPWTITEFGTERGVAVAKGVIEMEAGYPLSGITYHGELPTSDYELQLDAMKLTGNDFFCAVTFPVEQSHCTLVLGGWGGTTTGLSCIDHHDASDNATTQYIHFAANQWYHVRIRVRPEKISCWLDDKQIIDQPLEGKTVSLRNEVLLSRPLGICSFATASKVKNIRLVRLPTEAQSNKHKK